MKDKLPKYIACFRNDRRTQHSLVTILEKRKSILDKEEYDCCLFMDPSKAFCTINHVGKFKSMKFFK